MIQFDIVYLNHIGGKIVCVCVCRGVSLTLISLASIQKLSRVEGSRLLEFTSQALLLDIDSKLTCCRFCILMVKLLKSMNIFSYVVVICASRGSSPFWSLWMASSGYKCNVAFPHPFSPLFAILPAFPTSRLIGCRAQKQGQGICWLQSTYWGCGSDTTCWSQGKVTTQT